MTILQEQELEVPLEVVSSLKKFRGKTFVIKYGGSIINNEIIKKAFIKDVVLMKKLGINLIIVHGGGPEISKWLKKVGIESRFQKGLRVTDDETMEIVEMVLSGKINKALASILCINDINSVGISGRDGSFIKAKKKYLYEGENFIDIGFVGEVVSIKKDILINMIKNGQVPVISPIGCDDKGNRYNINADYVAAAISAELNCEKLIILTDVEGIYKDVEESTSLIQTITVDEIKEYIHEGIIKGGMIPKLECCIKAIEEGTVNTHLIDGRKEHSLILDIVSNKGTRIITKEGLAQCQEVI